MQPMKNVAASAKSGMEKTKATVQEKVKKMTSRDPVEKEEATQKKDARIAQAEMEKQEAKAHNTNTNTHSYSTTGATGHSTGLHQMSAMPGHGTGQPTGHVTDGVVGSHPTDSNTGTGRVGGTGGTYNY